MAILHFRSIERRRTARAAVSVNVLVHGETGTGETFKFWSRTVSVSGFGGAVIAEAPLEVGQIFHLVNEYNSKKAKCQVVSVRRDRSGVIHAAFQFIEGRDNFWSMTFPAAGAKALKKLVPARATG